MTANSKVASRPERFGVPCKTKPKKGGQINRALDFDTARFSVPLPFGYLWIDQLAKHLQISHLLANRLHFSLQKLQNKACSLPGFNAR
jgi:hypothetical protein